MDLNTLIDNRKLKNNEIRILVNESERICLDFFKRNYIYSDKEAVEELGVESDLIEQLIEDYVIQIINCIVVFEEHLSILKREKYESKALNYTSFRELAHKNLGVARNLRIKDSEEILNKLLKKDDLEYLENLLHVLEACVVKLNPTKSYETMQLIKLKKFI